MSLKVKVASSISLSISPKVSIKSLNNSLSCLSYLPLCLSYNLFALESPAMHHGLFSEPPIAVSSSQNAILSSLSIGPYTIVCAHLQSESTLSHNKVEENSPKIALTLPLNLYPTLQGCPLTCHWRPLQPTPLCYYPTSF